MLQELWGERMVNSDFKTKLEACPSRIAEVDQKILKVKSKINDLDSKLNSGHLSSNENAENINTMKTSYSNELTQLENTKNNYVKDIQEVINQSDIFGFFSDLIDKYQSVVDTLSLEQLVALFNIIGYGMILMTLISISTLLVGDY